MNLKMIKGGSYEKKVDFDGIGSLFDSNYGTGRVRKIIG